MSSKSSLFLTIDNEHCYEECNEPNYKNGKMIGFTITMEMSKENIEIVVNDKDDLIIDIKPGSELYNHILKMKE